MCFTAMKWTSAAASSCDPQDDQRRDIMMTHFWVLETPSELWSIQIQYLFKGAAACPGKSLNHFSLETIVQN